MKSINNVLLKGKKITHQINTKYSIEKQLHIFSDETQMMFPYFITRTNLINKVGTFIKDLRIISTWVFFLFSPKFLFQ